MFECESVHRAIFSRSEALNAERIGGRPGILQNLFQLVYLRHVEINCFSGVRGKPFERNLQKDAII